MSLRPFSRSLVRPGRRAVLGGLAGIGVLAGGGILLRDRFDQAEKEQHAQPDGVFRKLKLACPHPSHDPVLAMALRDGFLDRYNLDITVLDGADTGRQALDQLRTGAADVAIAPALSWLPQLLGGLEAKLICGLQSGSSRLLVDRRSRFKRIEDLYRHAIALPDAAGGPDAGADRLFFSIVMRRKGMNPNKDVTWISVAPERFGEVLASGQVQAVGGHDPVIWEAQQSLHLAELASSMTGSYSARVVRVLGARDDLLARDPRAAVSLVLAFQEAARVVASHLAETASVMADQIPDMPQDSILKMLQAEKHDVHPVGQELREQIAQYVDELKLIGLVDENQDSGSISKRFCATILRG
ncbi:ABC transporter substrate-binding protein [Acetobacteraceae bacterium KSS8]|uniref:ABC transporter substrate-binding protein n=1 Tax=Endosaccharibacter trunci TaxID=2812733 RepID=A0ABT1W7L1_9PROT|nr:ABC transporter substrate-binding protein [Acetobacteraceae bacterium KSS8]